MVRWHRVAYPIERAQQRILKAGLPKVLADRLAAGVVAEPASGPSTRLADAASLRATRG